MSRIILIITILLSSAIVLNSQCNEECDDSRTVYGFDAGDTGTGIHAAFFGVRSGFQNTGISNSFFGYEAGSLNTTGHSNSFFGVRAGINNKTGDSNSFFGAGAGFDNSTGADNSFFGAGAGNDNSTGDSNSFFGAGAGNDNSTGADNSFFGRTTGANNNIGHSNSFFGAGAGFNNNIGHSNSFFGQGVGQTNSTGHSNSFFGALAGLFNSTGHSNSFFGELAGANTVGDSCVSVGANSGPLFGSGNVSNRLYIDVKPSSNPLIYGEFDNDFVRINGTFEAMAVGNNSDINRKELIVGIDPAAILDKIVELPISEWSYKDDDIRHIGPMAQDFYAAFNVGKNETTITTIDADGVALASIQALYQLWQDEKEVNREQSVRVQKFQEEQKKLIQLLLTRIEKLENK